MKINQNENENKKENNKKPSPLLMILTDMRTKHEHKGRFNYC